MRPKHSSTLFTDLYELTMSQAYWHAGKTASGTFSLSIRTYPPGRGYFVLSGINDVVAHLEKLRFSRDDLDYLRSLGLFDGAFLDYLANLRFTGTVRAMPEGSIFFANEPVLEVEAPVIEGQILETLALNRINFQSVLATKASRIVHAARGRLIVDFGARRAHGIDAADHLARASYLVGFAGSSNLRACARFGIPAFGTMAHSFITAFDDEREAFMAYARSFPDTCTFLVDTYDAADGLRKAVQVALRMRQEGRHLVAVRLDSGDLRALSIEARRLLDDSGLDDVQVFASGGLDEFEIERLLREDAPIDGFGVGTNVGVSADAPWTDCTYKLVEYAGRPLRKFSVGKETLAGPKQVFRTYRLDGSYENDTISLSTESPDRARVRPLLDVLMMGGKVTSSPPTLADSRQHFAREFARLPDRYKRLRSPETYRAEVSNARRDVQDRIRLETLGRDWGSPG